VAVRQPNAKAGLGGQQRILMMRRRNSCGIFAAACWEMVRAAL
jgi:hypothetical protein